MTAAQILERLGSLDMDPAFLFNGILLCFWCQNPVDMGFTHADECPWGALRKRHKKSSPDPFPELVDLPGGSGVADIRPKQTTP